MKQHLVILCNNLEEAKNAALTLPVYKSLNKFYVFNFEIDSNTNLNWISPDDDYISLGKASELGNSAEICIRAAILYIVNWWHLIFCYAHDLPSSKDLNKIKHEIDSKNGFVQDSKTWAISKEHLLLFGMGKILGSGIVKNQEEELKNELEIVKAFRGEPCGFEALIQAFEEVVNIEGIITQGILPNYSSRAGEFIEYFTRKYEVINENPGLIFISPEISQSGFELLLKQIEPRTMICLIEEEDKDRQIETYKKFNCNNEFYVKIFIKGA